MQLKICYQTDENDIETEIMLTNEKCSYKVPQYKENCESHSSLSSQLSQVNSSMAWMKVQISTDSCGYPTTFCEQFSILLCRMIKQISRNRQGEDLYTSILIRYLFEVPYIKNSKGKQFVMLCDLLENEDCFSILIATQCIEFFNEFKVS